MLQRFNRANLLFLVAASLPALSRTPTLSRPSMIHQLSSRMATKSMMHLLECLADYAKFHEKEKKKNQSFFLEQLKLAGKKKTTQVSVR